MACSLVVRWGKRHVVSLNCGTREVDTDSNRKVIDELDTSSLPDSELVLIMRRKNKSGDLWSQGSSIELNDEKDNT